MTTYTDLKITLSSHEDLSERTERIGYYAECKRPLLIGSTMPEGDNSYD
jgi:hypothetical protein